MEQEERTVDLGAASSDGANPINAADNYTTLARILHWGVGGMVMALLTVGFIMTDMTPSPEKFELYAMHKASGVVALMMISLRFLRRLFDATMPLALPAGSPIWQQKIAHLTHYLLYVCMFAMPISGIVMSLFSGRDIDVFGFFVIKAFEVNNNIAWISRQIHGFVAFSLAALIILHILGSLYHHFIRRDKVLTRMIKTVS